jgi:hypothetical protein
MRQGSFAARFSGPQNTVRFRGGRGATLRFLTSILDGARNSVDSLQAMVLGYRDRIAHIYLDREQGGLNLAMSAQAVNEIADYGEQAGEKLINRFIQGMDNGKISLASCSRWQCRI